MFLNINTRENPQAVRGAVTLNTAQVFALIPLRTLISSQLKKADLLTHDLAHCQSPEFVRF